MLPRMSSHCYKKYAAFLPWEWLKTACFWIEDCYPSPEALLCVFCKLFYIVPLRIKKIFLEQSMLRLLADIQVFLSLLLMAEKFFKCFEKKHYQRIFVSGYTYKTERHSRFFWWNRNIYNRWCVLPANTFACDMDTACWADDPWNCLYIISQYYFLKVEMICQQILLRYGCGVFVIF